MRSRPSLIALVLLGSSLLPAALLAEDVYLKNGRAFRGVIATVDGGMVRIEMPGGTLSFPMSTVLRIEASDAAYRQYQSRRDALAGTSAPAGDWLELARWAKAQGLEPAAREAGLEAARINPTALGLRAFLAELGFVYDETSGSFLAFEESMARQGLVYDGGAWITLAEREARRERAREETTARYAQTEAEPAAVSYRESVEPDEVVGVPISFYGGGYYGPGVGVWPGGGGGGRHGHGGGHRPGIGPPGGLQPGTPAQLPERPAVPPQTGGTNRGRLQPMNISPSGAGRN